MRLVLSGSPTVGDCSQRTSGLAGSVARRRGVAPLILVLCPALLTLVQYGAVPRVDPGVLALSDDALFMNRVREPFTIGTLFLIYGEHLMPTTYLYYRLLYALVGTSWPLYGWLLVAGHSLVCTAVGVTIWTFGRSLVAALAITVPLTVSFSFAAGPLSYFINMQHYLMYLSYLVVVLLLHRFLVRGTAYVYVLMMALSAFCILLTTPAVFLLPILVIYHVAFRLLAWWGGRGLPHPLLPRPPPVDGLPRSGRASTGAIWRSSSAFWPWPGCSRRCWP
jgi:hypothetical protein